MSSTTDFNVLERFILNNSVKGRDKAIPVLARRVPERSRKLV